MITSWIEQPLAYDGTQLRAHWIYSQLGKAGDALVAWRGPCGVRRDEIADLADIDGPGIAADDMVHFVWESFVYTGLLLAVHRQRLLSAQAAEVLQELGARSPVRRRGDDLYVGSGKLSISIATRSPVSCLIHFAVNATRGGAPVPIASLADLGVAPKNFADALLQRASEEQHGIGQARALVRVKGEWQA